MPARHAPTDRKALVVTAPLRYGGRSANMNSSAINKHCAFRQVSASKSATTQSCKPLAVMVGRPPHIKPFGQIQLFCRPDDSCLIRLSLSFRNSFANFFACELIDKYLSDHKISSTKTGNKSIPCADNR